MNKAMERVLTEETIVDQRQTKMHKKCRSRRKYI